MKKLKKFTLRYIFESFFYDVEKNFHNIAKLIRFHSIVREPNLTEGLRVENIEIFWFNERYLSSFRTLATVSEVESLDFSKNEKTELLSIATEDFFIDGHIKAPIRKTDRTLIAFNGEQRLRWGDVYPNPFFLKKYLDGYVIFIPNIENYYHLIVDYILPALNRFNFDNKYDNSKIFFVTQRRLPILDFFQEYLISKGYNAEIYRIYPFQRVYGKALIMGRAKPRDPGCYFVFANLMNEMNEFIDKKISKIMVSDYAYIKRTQTPRRRLLNETEIISYLEKFGFDAVSLNFENYLYQIALFRKAKVIISTHGASLTNLIWSRNTKVIEIFPKNLKPKHYLNISSQLNLEYCAALGGEAQSREDFIIDPIDLESKINQLI